MVRRRPSHSPPARPRPLPVHLSSAAESVIRVGDGRGFVVSTSDDDHRMIVTAAHCLPQLPSLKGRGDTPHDHIYPDLLGPLDAATRIWCDCVFADPVADVAVLQEPDNQELTEQWENYRTFVEGQLPLRIAPLPRGGAVFLLSLGGGWEESRAVMGECNLTLVGAHSVPGMSGSPILDKWGRAVSVVRQGMMEDERDSLYQPGQPTLVNRLPLWLLAAITPSSVFAKLHSFSARRNWRIDFGRSANSPTRRTVSRGIPRG